MIEANISYSTNFRGPFQAYDSVKQNVLTIAVQDNQDYFTSPAFSQIAILGREGGTNPTHLEIARLGKALLAVGLESRFSG